ALCRRSPAATRRRGAVRRIGGRGARLSRLGHRRPASLRGLTNSGLIIASQITDQPSRNLLLSRNTITRRINLRRLVIGSERVKLLLQTLRLRELRVVQRVELRLEILRSLLGIGASLTLRLQRLLAAIAQNLARIALLSIGLGSLDSLSRGLVSHVPPSQPGPHRSGNNPRGIAPSRKTICCAAYDRAPPKKPSTVIRKSL